MAEFRSSARSTGFNAITVPDNARRIQQEGEKRVRDLRRVYEKTIEQKKQFLADSQANAEAVERQLNRNDKLDSEFRRSYEQALRKRESQKIQKLKDKQKLEQDKYERLGTFSKGAMELGKELYENHKEERQAYGMALVMQTGVTAEELAQLKRKEIDLEVEGASMNRTIDRLKAAGAGASEIKRLKDLDGWALYGAQKALAQQAKTAWYAFSNNPDRRNKKYKVGDQELSLADAELAGMSSERANIIGQMKAEFFKPYSNYDLAFAEKYMFPGMREVDQINQTAYTTELGRQLEKTEKQERYTEIGTALNSKEDTGSFERILNMAAPDGGPVLGAKREQLMNDLIDMAEKGMLSNQDLLTIRSQQFTMNGKKVSFTDAFLKGKGRFSPTGMAFTRLERIVRGDEVAKQQLKEQEIKIRINRFENDLVTTIAANGGQISNAEIEKALARHREISGGRPMSARLQKIFTNQALGVDQERQYQAALADIDSLDTFVEIQQKYDLLTPQQQRQIANAAGIDPKTNTKIGKSFTQEYFNPIEQELRTAMGTINSLNPGSQVSAMMVLTKQKFMKELQVRLGLKANQGRSEQDVATELMLDYVNVISENKPGSFWERTGLNNSAAFKQLKSGVNKGDQLREIEETLGGNYDRLLSPERLLGKDPNEDPDSLASQIPYISATGTAPEWLLQLSEKSGIHWKTIFNVQAQAYDGPQYVLPLARDEGMQEVVRPQFSAFLGRHPSPATLQQASSQFQRSRGISGTEVYRPILNLIASQESSNDEKYDGYDAMNLGGTNGGFTPIGSGTGTQYFQQPLMSYTIGEIRQMQANGQIHAAGRYQFLGQTIDDVFNRALPPGLTMDSPFDENTQDLLAIAYFRLTIKDYTASGGDPIDGLGQRWIGLQKIPYNERLRIVRGIQKDPRYQTPGFQGFEVDPDFEAARRKRYGK